MTDPEIVYPPGLVGVIAQDTARFSLFAASVTNLDRPEGTTVSWQIGHSIPENTNSLVRELLASQNARWLWILGDDHVFDTDILYRLLAHEKDIVVPLCLMRQPPFKPVAYTGFVGETKFRQRVALDDFPDGGLIQVHSAGSAGMLIRSRVFDAIEPPWFEANVLNSETIGEDLYFCDKARDAGFEVWLDLDTPLGHITTATVWPVHRRDNWTFGFTMSGGFQATMNVGTWNAMDADERSRA